MIKNQKAESLVGIVIWISILAFTILWIANMINYSNSVIDLFERTTRLSILQNNVNNIIKNIDTSNINQDEIFFIYKNETTKTFEIFTGSTNEEYKYIDIYGNKIDDLLSYEWDIYSRILWLSREDTSIDTQNQIIKASIRRLIRK